VSNGLGEGSSIEPLGERPVRECERLTWDKVGSLVLVAVVFSVLGLGDPERVSAVVLIDCVEAPAIYDVARYGVAGGEPG